MLEAVAEHYRTRQRLSVATVALLHSLWSQMTDDLDGSWAAISARAVLVLQAGQVAVAKDSARFVPDALSEQGIDTDPVANVDPTAFAVSWPLVGGQTGSLDDLLYGSVIAAKQAQVNSLPARLAVGRSWLDTVAVTQLSDTGRQVVGVSVAATPRTGWVRMVNPPCCQRCAVLAGRFYRWSSGFKRHPHCDCSMTPSTEADSGKVAQRIGPGDVKDLTDAQRSAIADGADMNQVINATRGRSVRSLATTEGTTKRGTARAAMRRAAGTRGPRLTPEAIYKVAATRDEAVKLLKAYGYIF